MFKENTIDSRKFRHPNHSAPLRALIAIYSKVRRASQIFQIKIPYSFGSSGIPYVMQQQHIAIAIASIASSYIAIASMQAEYM